MASLLAWACAPAVEESAVSPGLAGSLEVELSGDTAWLTLHVTNTAAAPIVLEYPTAQRYDFEVWTRAGERAWQWSAERAFAQVVTEEALAPGATLRFREAWRVPAAGEYEARGRLLARTARLELRTPFEVGGGAPGQGQSGGR